MPEHYYHRKPHNDQRSLNGGGPFSPYPSYSPYPGIPYNDFAGPGTGLAPFQGAGGLGGAEALVGAETAAGAAELVTAAAA
ncbi:hypothetical protein P9847_27195, partial [Paenibacillus chibensis]|nr:hypothetical protein [Paenibacillus chibensis]